VVQALDGRVLSDAALPARPRGPQLGTGGGKSLSSFGQSRGGDCSRPDGRAVQHQHLAAETFNPMPSLRTGVVKLATTVSARRKRKGGDNSDEHHRDQRDRRQQNGSHHIDSTPRPPDCSPICAGRAGKRVRELHAPAAR
jgi:hypothetical protein